MTGPRPAGRRAGWRVAALLAAGLVAGPARAGQQAPSPAPLRVIGTEAAGCIAGAVELPPRGPGFEEIRASRSTFWGAPSTVAAIEQLGREARAAGLPDFYVGDFSRPRGGPMAGIHASHMQGLDADIYLDMAPKPALSPAARDALDPPSLVRPDGRGIDPARWNPRDVTLLRLATRLPGVERVLVNAAIKRQLCDTVTGDRSWLRLIRPWYGHSAHMHIHFRCPADQPACVTPPPPPPGDGCDATLQWWFDRLEAPPPPPAPPAPPKPLPAACRAILAGP